KQHWGEWLCKKYNGDITKLWRSWGVSGGQNPFAFLGGEHSSAFNSFADAPLPARFDRNRSRREEDYGAHGGIIADFTQFASESFSSWGAEIRATVKDENPDIVYMMGRDEPLRIPTQQYEARRGNIELVNWHQYHRDNIIFSEYIFNRVRGMVCCGQELGVMHYAAPSGLPGVDEAECAAVMERRLLYSFGNWVIWQGFSDPYETHNCELGLGLFRTDNTPSGHVPVVSKLSAIEDKIAEHCIERNENAIQTLMIYPTSRYFSVDSTQAHEAAINAVMALHYTAHLQAELTMESDFCADNAAAIGDPKLIIWPTAVLVADGAWEHAIALVKEGKTLLLCGFAEQDANWNPTKRLAELGIEAELQPLSAYERFTMGEPSQVYDQQFRVLTQGYSNSKAGLRRLVLAGETQARVSVHNVGRGKIILCPVPLEAGDDADVIAAVYGLAAEIAGVERTYAVRECTPGMFIYPIEYKNGVVYTVINEGSDGFAEFTDAKTGARIEVAVKAGRGCKFMLDNSGKLIEKYDGGSTKIWVS
ncbi:MAG: hypothetical protein FWD16_08160, partial [Clostridia bacterium]|nr:hypothetical protein [Clostridia bacterium]